MDEAVPRNPDGGRSGDGSIGDENGHHDRGRAGSPFGTKPVRLDKWLWAARFYKTRGLAQTAVEKGQVLVGGERVKVARNLRIGEMVSIAVGDIEREVEVAGLSDVRRAAPIAQALYRETPESIANREAQAQRRKLFREPAHAIVGRPTKRDRRDLTRIRDSGDA
jgi:ribosome-associated heat shock protein Hsp15